jgi:hypothetical protein
MSGYIQERYTPVPLGVAVTYVFPSGSPTGIGGFLCITAGTITVTRSDGVVLVNAFPMTAGTYVPMPFATGAGATVTLGAGASGTLGVS